MRLFAGIVLALGAAVCSGCGGQLVTTLASASSVRGSGVVKEENRDVSGFTKLEVSSAIKAVVTVSDATTVQVKADDNILKLVKTDVKGDTLVVGFVGSASIESRDPVIVTITTPQLTAITAQSASKVTATFKKADRLTLSASAASHLDAKGLEAENIDVDSSSASAVTLEGKAGSLKATISAASKLNASSLTVENARVEASGASHAEVHVSHAIEGSANGASTVTIAGNPRERNMSSGGASNVSFP